jgi:hypothetical protein
MNNFDENILKIIEKFSYKFFVVITDHDVKCTCLNGGTTQADPACKKCLGTGFKIKIKEVEGASTESGAPKTIRGSGGFIVAKSFYIKSEYNIELNLDDIIVDGNEVYIVYQGSEKTSFHGQKVYKKYTGIPKKTDATILLKNFNKIVGR